MRTWRTWSRACRKGYERKLELVGVGYRAAVQGKKLNLTLGFSHPVVYAIPEGITIETPTPDRNRHQGHGPAEASARWPPRSAAYRPPEPYKGKGVRYSGEKIELKEAKKK